MSEKEVITKEILDKYKNYLLLDLYINKPSVDINYRPSSILVNPFANVNQYTIFDLKKLDLYYLWLISITKEKWDDTFSVCCWIPTPNTKGIDFMEKSRQHRASLKGNKILLHVFTKLFWEKPKNIEYEVSHLCQNHICIRPSHLHWESHLENMSRIGCIGWICVENMFIRVCKHKPSCLTYKFGIVDSNPKKD